MDNHELHRKCHFCPVSRSCTITLLTYLWQFQRHSHTGSNEITWAKNCMPPRNLIKYYVTHSYLFYQAGCCPELSCHSLIICSSPREKGVVSKNMSSPPLSNTGFSGSVTWWGSLSPSVPCKVTVTWSNCMAGLILKWHNSISGWILDDAYLRRGGGPTTMSSVDTQQVTIFG